MQQDPPVRRTLGFLLADTSRLMRRHFVQRSREMGLPLNRSEASVLVHVDREPGLSQAQLAEKMDLEPISLVRLVDSLQEAGLIERRSHAHDRRIRTLWLTKAARPILVQVRAVAEDVRGRALAGLSQADREALLDLLVAVRTNLATHGGKCACSDDAQAMAATPASRPASIGRAQEGSRSGSVARQGWRGRETGGVPPARDRSVTGTAGPGVGPIKPSRSRKTAAG
jgi:MarR family transcriptional regulator, transcriptional regulator for hemolysin